MHKEKNKYLSSVLSSQKSSFRNRITYSFTAYNCLNYFLAYPQKRSSISLPIVSEEYANSVQSSSQNKKPKKNLFQLFKKGSENFPKCGCYVCQELSYSFKIFAIVLRSSPCPGWLLGIPTTAMFLSMPKKLASPILSTVRSPQTQNSSS